MAAEVYDPFDARDIFFAIYPEGKHGFPPEARQQTYAFLDRVLKNGKT